MRPRASWMQHLLEYGDGLGEAFLIKRLDGVAVAANTTYRELWSSSGADPDELSEHPTVADLILESDLAVRRSGTPLNLLCPVPLGWVRLNKSVMRDYLVVALRRVENRAVASILEERFPALNRGQAEFIVDLLVRAVRSQEGEVRLGQLPWPDSTAKRYLRQLAALDLVQRERTGRGLRILPSYKTFCPRPCVGARAVIRH